MLTNAEKIAEKIEAIIEEAKQLNVNVYALVQANSQGAIYYHCTDKEALANIIKNTIADFKNNEFEVDGIDNVSYRL